MIKLKVIQLYLTLLTICQNNKIRVRTVIVYLGVTGLKFLTVYQVNRTSIWVRTICRYPNWPGMKSLTYCQTSGDRVEVKIVRRQSAGPSTTSLTSFKPIGPYWEWGQSKYTQLDLACNHSLPIKSSQQDQHVEKIVRTYPAGCYHEITYSL